MARHSKKVGRTSIGYTWSWYDYYTKKVCLAYWKNGERHFDEIDFDWYFYADTKRCEKFYQRDVDFKQLVDRVEVQGKYWKIFCPWSDKNQTRKKLVNWLNQNDVSPLEADVSPADRYVIDNDVVLDRPSVLFYDFESDPTLGWVTDQNGKQQPHPEMRMLSWAYGETTDAVKFGIAEDTTDKAESNFFDSVLDTISQYDMIVAWNGDGFDEPLMRNAAKRLGFQVAWNSIGFLDLMELFKHPYFGYGRDSENKGVRLSFALNNIADKILGWQKVEGVAGVKMLEVWKHEKAKLEEYNIQDVRIMCALEEKTGYIDSHSTMAHICHRFPSSKTIKAGYLNDGFLLWYGKEHDSHFLSKHHVFETGEDEDVIRTKAEGAFVKKPVLGMHSDVVDFDFASLYPNLIRTFNVSPEMKVSDDYEGESCLAFNGVRFRTDKIGMMPSIVDFALKGRAKYKKDAARLLDNGKDNTDEYKIALQKSASWKVLANAFYGLMLSPYSRIYDLDCGEAITKSGQAAFHFIEELAEKSKSTVLYGDTDSIYVKGIKNKQKFVKHCSVEIDKWVQTRGARPGFIRLDVDAEYDRIFWIAKKKYAGKLKSGKIDVKGMEYIRSDGCDYMRRMQKVVIDYLLGDDNPTYDKIEKIIKNWGRKLLKGDVSLDDILLHIKLSKPIGQYKSNVPQVRVAKKMLEAKREVYVGMKIPYFIRNVDDGKANVIPAYDFDDVFDQQHYWRKLVYPATKRILDSIFPKQELLWRRIERWNPFSKQKDIFESEPVNKMSEVVFIFKQGDEKHFVEISDILSEFGGTQKLRFDLDCKDFVAETNAVFDIDLCFELVARVERVVGHRVYYGSETLLKRGDGYGKDEESTD